MTRADLRVKSANNTPYCLGTGFLAMDIVEGETGRFAAAGGSCGNVMAILAFLGWRAAPLARLGDDVAGRFVKQQMTRLAIDTAFVKYAPSVQTPIVIQRFKEDSDGHRTHRFSLSCPDCGSWLPRYRPTTIAHAKEVMDDELSSPKVFYFDRVSPAALKLAEWSRENGALVVFEPSSINEERQFQRAVDLTHILKYSHERLGHVPDLAKVVTPKIIVETHGHDGLRVRWKSRWSSLPAFSAPRFKDAAGSGDWCSSGIIHVLGDKGSEGLRDLNKKRLEHTLKIGQALAAINCGFEGARGAMNALDLRSLNKSLGALTGDNVEVNEPVAKPTHELPLGLCDACHPNDPSDSARRIGQTAA